MFERKVEEVAPTVDVLGWDAAKELHQIEIPEWLLPSFRMALVMMVSHIRRGQA